MSDPFALDDEPRPLASPPSAPPAETAKRQPPGYLDRLNPEQREAVETTEGPVLVLAGAGTGKTRVLTVRLAHLLATGRALPGQVLAVTFTNKAAQEMRERVADMIGPPAMSLWLGTFHSVGVRILRAHPEKVGLKAGFTVLDADDQLRLLKQIMAEQNIDPKRFPPQMLMGAIQGWKDKGLGPNKVDKGDDMAEGRALGLYRAYQDRLLTLNAADFGDLLLHCLTLFTQEPEILERYQDRFRYILVDEYQDTNVAQYLWLRLLARKHGNLCCVGDDDQSVYSWRGAEIDNILRFEHDFPGARIVRLERNYRSTEHILGAASGLIARNAGRLGKKLYPGDDRKSQGHRVAIQGVWSGEDEARIIGEWIEEFRRQGRKLSQIAILVRAGFQTREFEERLMRVGLPYRVIGGPRFYERQEIRDAVAYLRLIAQPDDSLAFERIVNLPRRGLGETTIHALHVVGRAERKSLFAAAVSLVETDELKPKARASLAAFLADVRRWATLSQNMTPSELARQVLDQSGYAAMWKTEKTPDAPGRVENLKELVAALEPFETLSDFLDHVSLVMENDANAGDDKVSLMTLHGAKGLEFDIVFLPGWEEGLFPHPRAIDESGLKGLEEERRLAYVGLTRARDRALITHAGQRRVYNQWQHPLPSRFLEELPEEHVERQGFQGLDVRPGLSETGSGWTRGRRKTPDDDFNQESYDEALGLKPGDRVFHQKFGYGRVSEIEGAKLGIAFDKAGLKKVMASFVEKA